MLGRMEVRTMSQPIPQHLIAELVGCVEHIYYDDTLPEDIWWWRIQDAVAEFMGDNFLEGSYCDGTAQIIFIMQNS